MGAERGVGIMMIYAMFSFDVPQVWMTILAVCLMAIGGYGIFGVELNHITAMLSAIMIGVGVDYTIHFLWRYRQERQGGLDAPDAIRTTLTTTGRGIVFNALSVIVGFIALLFSAFTPVNMFGFLIVVSIGACLVGALVVLRESAPRSKNGINR